MAKNIEMNHLNGNGEYEVVYPKASSDNILVSSEMVGKYGLSDNTMESLIDTIGKPQQSGFYMNKETVILEELGQNWTKKQQISQGPFDTICSNEDKSKLVGVNATNYSCYSYDYGATWTTTTAPDRNTDYENVYYFNGVFIGSIYNGGDCWNYSNDGATFSYCNFPSGTHNSNGRCNQLAIKDGVAYTVSCITNNGRDGVADTVNIFKSTDGINFTKIGSTTIKTINMSIYGFFYINNKFLLIGYDEAKVSSDLTSWSSSSFYPGAKSMNNDSIYMGKIGNYIFMNEYGKKVYFTNDGTSFASVSSSASDLCITARNMNSVNINGVEYFNGMKSTDGGYSWIDLTSATTGGSVYYVEPLKELRYIGGDRYLYTSKKIEYNKAVPTIYSNNKVETNGFMSYSYYMGSGSTSTMSVSFERDPALVYIFGSDSYVGMFFIDNIFDKCTGKTLYNGSTSAYNNNATYSKSTKTLSWHASSSASINLNVNGVNYCVYALYY